MHIPISVPKATVGCDICIEGPSQVQRVYVEPTLTTVRDGHKATALVVNTTGGSQACVASVDQLPSNSERGQDPTLSSYVSELTESLLKLLGGITMS